MTTMKDKWSVEELEKKLSLILHRDGRPFALQLIYELVKTSKINKGVFIHLIQHYESNCGMERKGG